MTITEPVPSATTTHPLARLTAEQITLANSIIRDAGLIGASTRFVYLGLEEPHKRDVLAWSPGDALDRRVRALLLDRATGNGRDVTVSLTSAVVLKDNEIDGVADGQVPILDAEFEARSCSRWQGSSASRPPSSSAMRPATPSGPSRGRRTCRWSSSAPSTRCRAGRSSAWGDKGAVERAAADPGTMLADTAKVFVGRFASDLVSVLLVTSLLAAVLSFHNVSARYLFALGNSGVLPKHCGRSHGRHGSPHVASVIVSAVAGSLVLVSVLTGLDPVLQVFTWLAGIATVGVVGLMLFTCLAVVVFFRRTRVDVRPWQTVIAPSLGLVALAYCLYLTVSNLPLLVVGSHLAKIVGGILLASVLAGPVVAVLRPNASAHTADL